MDAVEIGTKVAEAADGAEWLLAAAVLVIPLVELGKKVFGKKLSALAGGRGAWLLAIVTGAVLNSAQAIIRSDSPGTVSGWVRLLVSGGVAGLAAAGLYDGKSKKNPAEPPPTPTA